MVAIQQTVTYRHSNNDPIKGTLMSPASGQPLRHLQDSENLVSKLAQNSRKGLYPFAYLIIKPGEKYTQHDITIIMKTGATVHDRK